MKKQVKDISKESAKAITRPEALNLIFQADALIVDKGTDESLDQQLEKNALTGRIDNAVQKKYIVQKIRPYMKKFRLEFYEEIYRLRNWKITPITIRQRPGIVGKWTNQLIYCRFPKGILAGLQQRNPYIFEGVRLHKNFQWLTVIGEEELSQFIEDAIRIMKKSKYWSEFIRLFAQEFGKPYQADMFEGFTI